MQVRALRLQNFKRFTDLSLADIPADAKLVLLVGANGSGKSSVFDAFELVSRLGRGIGILSDVERRAYYAKGGADEDILLVFADSSVRLEGGRLRTAAPGPSVPDELRQGRQRLYGRSTLRVAARMSGARFNNGGLSEVIRRDIDSPATFIDDDRRFFADATKYAADFNHALRQPVFEGKQVDIKSLSDQLIKPINDALQRVFGQVGPAPQMTNFREPEEPGGPVSYYFRKGQHEFPYDVMSFGEKQVFAVLLNLFVRRDRLQDAVIYIDELDLHLNTALQHSLLEEIVEHWIPENSQLWTASHSLGFLRYASQSPRAAIFDFDALDFDQPQTLVPAPKDTSEVLEVAVPREYLPQLFAGRRLIYCEGKDAAKFNSVGLVDTVFASGGNKVQVFASARDGSMPGVVDRDYLTDTEIRDWEARIPTLRILRLYSIENYLYHPDNLAEHFGDGFERARYIDDLVAAKRDAYEDLLYGIARARDSYPFVRYLTKEERDAYGETGREVQRLLKSDDFSTFYPVFPMKEQATQLRQRQHQHPGHLARTQWFAKQMRTLLEGVPVIAPKRSPD